MNIEIPSPGADRFAVRAGTPGKGITRANDPHQARRGRRRGRCTCRLGRWASMSTCMRSAADELRFRRIVDIPFGTYVAALESCQRPGQDAELQIGPSRARGPIKHDRDADTVRFEVRLSRGRLRPLLCTRLDIDRRSRSSSGTALELIPYQRVRSTAAYFRAGHLLLDSFATAAAAAVPEQIAGRFAAAAVMVTGTGGALAEIRNSPPRPNMGNSPDERIPLARLASMPCQ